MSDHSTALNIPFYLSNRQIGEFDTELLKGFFADNAISVFGDITIEMINKYAQKDYETALKLCYQLGLYGVVFDGRKHNYSPNSRNLIVLIKAAKNDVDLFHLNLNTQHNPMLIYAERVLLSYLRSCGIDTVAHLDGINLSVLLDKTNFKDENIDEFKELFKTQFTEVYNGVLNEFYASADNIDVADFNKNYLDYDDNFGDLSKRAENTLYRNGIHNVGELLKYDLNNMQSWQNVGGKTLEEIKAFIAKYKSLPPILPVKKCNWGNIEENNPAKSNEVITIDNSFRDCYLIKIENTPIPTYIKLILLQRGIKKIGHLVQYSLEELLMRSEEFASTENCINDLSSIYEYIKSLGINDSPLVLSTEIKEKINEFSLEEIVEYGFSKYLFEIISEAIDELKEQYQDVLVKRFDINETGKISTLDGVAQPLGITRERVRQIVANQCLPKIKKYLKMNSLAKTKRYAGLLLNEFGKIFYLSEREPLLKFKHLYPDVFEEFNMNFNIDFESGFLSCSSFSKDDFYSNILDDFELNKVITKEELVEKFENALQDLVFKNNEEQQRNYEKTRAVLLDEYFKNFTEVESEKFILKQSNRNEHILQLFKEFYPDGVHLPIDKITELEKNLALLTKALNINRSIRTLSDGILKASSEVIIWKRGTYIHIDNVSPNWDLVDGIILQIIGYFDKGLSHFKIQMIFDENADQCISNGVPEATSLLGLIKYRNNERIGNKKLELFDKLNSVGFEGKVTLLEQYLLKQNDWVAEGNLQQYFCNERGWQQYEIYNYASNSNVILKSSSNYIHKNMLNIDAAALKQLISRIEETLNKTNSIVNLKVLKQEHPITWKTIVGQDIHPNCMGCILNEQTDLPFDIESRIYVKPKDFETEGDITFTSILNNWVKDECHKSNYVMRSQILDYCRASGLNAPTAISTCKRLGILEWEDGAFVHPEVIGFSDEWLNIIKDIIQLIAEDAYSTNNPHLQYQGILSHFEEDLPLLTNGLSWTTTLLKNLISKIDGVETFWGSFIFADNKFNVEDLDDLAAFLMYRTYKDEKCSLKQLDKLLAQEQVIEYKTINSLKPTLFFEGSSIQAIDEEQNVILSKVGRERYCNV